VPETDPGEALVRRQDADEEQAAGMMFSREVEVIPWVLWVAQRIAAEVVVNIVGDVADVLPIDALEPSHPPAIGAFRKYRPSVRTRSPVASQLFRSGRVELVCRDRLGIQLMPVAVHVAQNLSSEGMPIRGVVVLQLMRRVEDRAEGQPTGDIGDADNRPDQIRGLTEQLLLQTARHQQRAFGVIEASTAGHQAAIGIDLEIDAGQ